MARWYSFSDGEGPTRSARSATPSDVSSVDERYQRRHVLEPTPPSLTQLSVLAMPSAPVMTASGSTMTMPATPTKGGARLLSRTGSVKKWAVRGWRATSSTLSEVIGRFFFIFHFFQALQQPSHNSTTTLTTHLVQKPPCCLLRANYQYHRHVPQP